MRARGIILASAVFLFARTAMPAEPPSPHFEYTNDGFSITLPPGWHEVPSAYKLRPVAEERLGLVIADNVRIYQIAGQTNGEPPFVIVRVGLGRVPDFALRSLLGTNNNGANLKAFLRTESILPGNVRNVSFDTNRFEIHFDAVHEGSLDRHRALTRIFFTEGGRITISGVSTEADYPQWWGMFGQVVDSVKIQEPLRYRLRPPPNLSSGSRDWMILGAVILGVFLLGFGVYRFNTSGGSTADY